MRNLEKHREPLYRHVAQDIVAQIEAGDWRPGDRLPSERLLCDRYQVSQITVRRALRELAHEGRVYSHHGLGWFVSQEGQAGTRLAEAALIISQPDWLIWSLLPHLTQSLQEGGVRLQLVLADSDASALPSAASADVLILAISGSERQLVKRCGQLAQTDIPLALLLRELEGVSAPAIVLDQDLCMAQMTAHLVDRGHQRIAYVGNDPATVEGRLCYQGFAQMLWENGLELPLDWVFTGSLLSPREHARFHQALLGAARPTALVCASDLQAAEAISLVQEAGLRCPQDVAIVGFGERDLAALLSPPLTTFRPDFAGLASACAKLVLSLLAGQSASSVHLSGQMIVRQSSGADPAVR